jgi:2-haloacid dehalogenase
MAEPASLGAARVDAAPRVLIFDVFGTLVDWRRTVAQALQQALDVPPMRAESLADAWRAQYQPSMQAIRSGARAYTALDVLHRENLDVVLRDVQLESRLTPQARDELTMVWHRLDAWPDVTRALARLRPHFMLAPCSNGNVALMADLARHHGWHWDAIVGADMARDYKPQPIVYRRACEVFGATPAQVLMVAAHSSDLAAAAAVGLRTAFIARPDEHGPGLGEAASTVPVDWSANNLLDLAAQLGV